jgi:hypothetical protein
MSENVEAELLVPDDTADFISRGRPDDGHRSAVIERACCCPSRPSVRVLLAKPGEPGSCVDLLLCGHHYRLSRAALAKVHATVSFVGDLSL